MSRFYFKIKSFNRIRYNDHWHIMSHDVGKIRLFFLNDTHVGG